MKNKYDATSGVLKKTINGKFFEFSIQGIPTQTYIRLGLMGIDRALSNSKNPTKTWQSIINGSFGMENEKKFTPSVNAYSLSEGISREEAEKRWSSMTAKEKKIIFKSNKFLSARHKILSENYAMSMKDEG